jgi:DNA polymerase elongation subunit (family B)
MQTKTFFSYYWHTDNDNDTNTIIRIYGLDKDNKNVCVIVSNFTPYVYIELPKPYSQWNETTSQILGNKLDEILGEKKPIVKSFMRKYKLYYAYVDIKTKQRIKFPYLFCSFSNVNDIKNMFFKLKRNIFVQGVGSIKLKVHESDASPVLQMCCLRNIPTAGWIKFSGNLVDNVDEKITYCDYEYKVRWKNLSPDESNDVPLPLIMGYDIEVNSSVPSAMPESNRPKDKIFQISCSLSRPNMKEEEYENHLLSLGNPKKEKLGKNVILHTYDTESELLVGFTNFIKKYQPNIITGYNIFSFDIPYMIDRAKYCMCIYEFDQQSCIKNGHATEKSIKWSSSAYKDQFFQYLDAEGRLFVDLLPLIRRDYKFSNYKLKTVATNLIGQTKDDLSPQGIFKCYRVGMKGGEAGANALGICGKYCIKDTVLVLNLFEKIQCWIGLTEMAKVCKTSIFSLYTQGQQIKVYSQMYHDCTYKNYVVEKDGYITKEDEYFQGAMVFDPITGLHENVVSFDFNSLYPSTMIAYNLDYSTLVPDDSDIPDEMCGVFEWDEHQGCIHDPNMIKKNNYSIEIKVIDEEIKSLGKERDKKIDKLRKKDIQKQIDNLKLKKKPLIEKRAEYTKKKPKNIMCGKRKFRFLKSEYSVGLMPNILKDLIKARTTTRVEKKDVDEKIKVLKKLENLTKDQTEELSKLETLTIVLDKRQLAYKISANSAYGATGVRRGYLPCMPVAMTTTALGRRNIEKVANIIPEKYGGNLIYGDTDSVLPDTPVLISKNGNIEYMTVEELSDGNWKHTVTGKEISRPKNGLLVWSDKGFTKIKEVIRHAITKPLIRVTTHVGSVECSLDHSLLWENGEAAKGSDIKIGDKLCISELPLPDDTPKNPIYKNKLTEEIIETYIIPECYLTDNDMSAELAFVWGMFYAEGSCGIYKRKKNGLCSSWAISGQDNKLLTRCADILNKHEKKIQFKILDTMKSSNANKLVPYCLKKGESGIIKEFIERYRELFYDCRRSKRVPSVILNSPFDFRQAFFMGYYAGDGSKKDPAISLSNKGAIGSAGLFYIMKSIGYQVSINTRADKPTIYKLRKRM